MTSIIFCMEVCKSFWLTVCSSPACIDRVWTSHKCSGITIARLSKLPLFVWLYIFYRWNVHFVWLTLASSPHSRKLNLLFNYMRDNPGCMMQLKIILRLFNGMKNNFFFLCAIVKMCSWLFPPTWQIVSIINRREIYMEAVAVVSWMSRWRDSWNVNSFPSWAIKRTEDGRGGGDNNKQQFRSSRERHNQISTRLYSDAFDFSHPPSCIGFCNYITTTKWNSPHTCVMQTETCSSALSECMLQSSQSW